MNILAIRIELLKLALYTTERAGPWRDRPLEQIPSEKILKAAEEGKYGVIAAIVYDLEQILGLVRAALARSSLIVYFFSWAIKYSDELLVRTATDAASRASVPVSIHLHHAQDEAVIKLAADMLPFDSIMVDMSHYEKEENLRKTAEWVAYCHERGIATEAEPGRIEGGEDGVTDTEGPQASKTTPEEVDELIATGVDALAPAFGNIQPPTLNVYLGSLDAESVKLSVLAKISIPLINLKDRATNNRTPITRRDLIRKQINGRVRWVLHGTNRFSPNIMKQCIAAPRKINVNRLVLDDYYVHMRAEFSQKVPRTKLIGQGTEHVISLTKTWMDICGYSGKSADDQIGV
ncbi:aldolase [Xylariaceae sp. FL0255]|nr:aldolase [Xylariaceae sp. FL0255]